MEIKKTEIVSFLGSLESLGLIYLGLKELLKKDLPFDIKSRADSMIIDIEKALKETKDEK